jgi:hypothetical protein
MKRTLGFLFALLAAAGLASAKTLTVDNKPGSVAMFTSLQAAVDAADPGDILLIAGSPTSYGEVRLVKRLNFVGPGWDLEANRIPGVNVHNAQFGFSGGRDADGACSGSTFTGLEMRFMNELNLPAPGPMDALVFDRCKIYANDRFRDWKKVIRRSWIQGLGNLAFPGSSISNSIFDGFVNLGLGTTVNNCVFLFDGNLTNWGSHEQSSISSSIFVGRITPEVFRSRFKGSATYCMATAELDGPTFLPAGGENINGIAAEVAFVFTGTSDGRWRLRPNSPARGKGFNGVDMGAFGGATPYVLSGVPPIPRVTRFVVPSTVTSTSGLRFEVDAQAF